MKNLFFLFASTASLLAQGNLAPTGAPAPLMKSLDQIEPRIPITSLPVSISTSGSYYFTKNLQFTATTGSAITINSNDVTVDLGGFTLSSTPAVTGRAVDIGSHRGISVKNGKIVGNTTVIISGTSPNFIWTTSPAGFDIGIFDFSVGSQYQDLSIRGCRSFGLFATGGANTIIDKVSVSENGIYGISTEFSSVSNCNATSNGGLGIYAYSGSVANCTVSFNASHGIIAQYGSVTNVTARSNGLIGVNAEFGSVTGVTATFNGSNGIYANSGSVSHSVARSNSGTDLFATSAVVAFCKAGTANISGTLTGNLVP